MSNTPKLKLVELTNTASQALVVNTGGYAILDQMVDRTVKSRGVNTPPGGPSDGDAYIVGSSPTGLWSGKANQIAYWRNSSSVWQFITPLEGWTVRVQDDDDTNGVPKEYGYTGSAWAVPVVSAAFTGGTLSSALNEAPVVTIASASTVNIGAAAANTISVSGTTTITAFDSIASGAKRVVVFQGILTLTHNSTSLILPTAANITTAAGDVAEFVSLGSGNWRCTGYMRASGQPLAGGGGGGGLTNWTDSLSTSSPNATVPVAALTATNAATNVDSAIAPKGTGSVLAQVPDGTSTGGNKRGGNAVDLQTSRATATAVASGNFSGVLSGQRNTASGTSAVVPGGFQCVASNQYTAAWGRLSTASGDTSTAFGDSCTASGTSCLAFGNSCTAAGTYTMAGGVSCTVSGNSGVSLGFTNAVTGDYASALGGAYADTRGIIGYEARANGRFSANGDAQRGSLVLRRATSDATPTVLTSNASAPGTTNQVVLPNTAAFVFVAMISARDSSGNMASWEVKGAIKRGANAAATAIVGTPTVTSIAADAGASGWVIAASADTTNGALAITATGAAATSIKWVAQVRTVEVVG